MKTRLRIVTGKLLEPSGKEDICDQQYVAAQDALELERELHAVRDAVIKEMKPSNPLDEPELEELAWMATCLANQLERVPRLIASSDAGEGALSEQELAMIVTALRAFALSTSPKEGK